MDFEEMYVTPEEFEAAAALGITHKRVLARIYGGWRKADALTRPLRKQTGRTHWREIAEENGIDRLIFYNRVNRSGWSEERAATEPIQDSLAALLECNSRKRTISDAELAQAAENGIPKSVVHWRLTHGWSMEDACTRPVMTGPERGRASREKLDRRYGDWNAMRSDKKRG